MSRSRALFAVALAVGLVAPVAAQPTPKDRPAPAPRPLALNLLPYVGDKTLTAELKLTDDQVKTLTDFRKAQWDAEYTTPVGEFAKGQADRDAATLAVLKKTLTADQLTRGKQLIAQRLLQDTRSRGFLAGPDGTDPVLPSFVRVSPGTLRQYPEIAAAVKLTPEQQKEVDAAQVSTGGIGGPFGIPAPRIVLTPEQSAALKAFVGPAGSGNLRAAFNERSRGASDFPDDIVFAGGGLGRETPLSLLLTRRVQTELKLTEDQLKALQDLETRTQISRDDRQALSPEKYEARQKQAATEIAAGIAKVLKPEQATRFKQIQIWNSFSSRGGNTPMDEFAKFSVPAIAAGIGLTDDQKTRLAEIGKEFDAAAAKALQADEPIDAVKAKVEAAKKARTAAVEKLVPVAQRAKLKDVLGAEYQPLTGGPGIGGSLQDVIRANFGRHGTDFTTLSRETAMQDDLKLSEEQKKQVTAARTEVLDKFPRVGSGTVEEMEKEYAARSAFVAKKLAEILTPEQQKRFRELMIQYREMVASQLAGSLSTTSTVGLPGVAEDLKVTAEQKKRLLAGEAAGDVLTADQKAALKKLAGAPMKGEFALRPVGGPLAAQQSVRMSLLESPAVVAELKLTADQEYRLALALEAYNRTAQRTPFTPKGTDAEAAAKLRKAQEEALAAAEKAIDAALTPTQLKRLAQMDVQNGATNGLTGTFARPEVAEKLALTAEQKAKQEAIRADFQERALLAQAELLRLGRFGGGGGGVGPRDSYSQTYTAIRDRARAGIVAVLTDAQKATWKDVTGEPSRAATAVFIPRRAFGGAGARFDP